MTAQILMVRGAATEGRIRDVFSKYNPDVNYSKTEITKFDRNCGLTKKSKFHGTADNTHRNCVAYAAIIKYGPICKNSQISQSTRSQYTLRMRCPFVLTTIQCGLPQNSRH